MKEQVLKTMIAVVDETMKISKSDFYAYDLKTLVTVDATKPFLWCVRESATTLLTLDAVSEMEALRKSEKYRFSFMQNPTVWIDYFVTVAQWGGRVFYYDGEMLQEINSKQSAAYAKDIFMPVIEELKEYTMANFAEQDGGYTRKVDVEFCDNTFAQVMRIAHTDEGAELLKTLRRFRHYSRRAKDHHIYIANDFMDKSFTFIEIAGEETNRLRGGIIYDGGHWTIHT